MKRTIAVVLCVMICLALASVTAAAQDSPMLFKTKCAACHGQDGNADTPMAKKQNIKSFKSPEVQKMSDTEIQDMIANGGSKKMATHQFEKKGLTPEQIKGLAAYVKELGKK